MDHGLELIIPILEILGIEVSNILQNPGNIGKRIFSIQSYPGNSGSYDPYINPILEILDRTIHICSYVELESDDFQKVFALAPETMNPSAESFRSLPPSFRIASAVQEI